MKQTGNDTLWKSVLEDFFQHFLHFFFEDADQKFDMQRPFEFLNRELSQMSLGQRSMHPVYVDMLVKVYFKNSDDFMLFHVEVQGQRQAIFPVRMYNYFIRLMAKYKEQVNSYAILTDKETGYAPSSYTYDCCGTSITFRFNTYKIAAQKEAMLKEDKNPFAFIFLIVLLSHKAGQITDSELLEQKINLGEKIFKEDWSDNQKVRLLNFLRAYIYFENDEYNHRFEEAIDFLTGKNNKSMGITEMILHQAGEKVALKIAIKMIKKRADMKFIHETTGIPVYFLRKMILKHKRQSYAKRVRRPAEKEL